MLDDGAPADNARDRVIVVQYGASHTALRRRCGPPEGTGAGVISAQARRATVRVMHTHEEVTLAKSVCRVFGLSIEKENDHGHEDEKT